ncbi:SRPBCC domain-containing protein [Microbacterium betulae]|uniref:SRPBCC domain-containing protein n=1 Tax=Microbacterium betulae TaxID=2981139 RepID=A0AA97I5M4_9MICO|nr:SRPBCC domain-containing protein [Microbacterium sp. AB]WOF21645.1 SRPBCC domain-containing protein [Microbacterium sp. AB]
MAEDLLSVSTVVEATPAAVWRVLTDGRSAWWPGMLFEPEVGACLTETWEEDGETLRATGTVVGSDALRRLDFVWSEPHWHGTLAVSIRLASVGSGTEVTVIEQGFTSIDAPSTLLAEHVAGWRFHLDRLVQALRNPNRIPD